MTKKKISCKLGIILIIIVIFSVTISAEEIREATQSIKDSQYQISPMEISWDFIVSYLERVI